MIWPEKHEQPKLWGFLEKEVPLQARAIWEASPKGPVVAVPTPSPGATNGPGEPSYHASGPLASAPSPALPAFPRPPPASTRHLRQGWDPHFLPPEARLTPDDPAAPQPSPAEALRSSGRASGPGDVSSLTTEASSLALILPSKTQLLWNTWQQSLLPTTSH